MNRDDEESVRTFALQILRFAQDDKERGIPNDMMGVH
jgi:hypothetical protein